MRYALNAVGLDEMPRWGVMLCGSLANDGTILSIARRWRLHFKCALSSRVFLVEAGKCKFFAVQSCDMVLGWDPTSWLVVRREPHRIGTCNIHSSVLTFY